MLCLLVDLHSPNTPNPRDEVGRPYKEHHTHPKKNTHTQRHTHARIMIRCRPPPERSEGWCTAPIVSCTRAHTHTHTRARTHTRTHSIHLYLHLYYLSIAHARTLGTDACSPLYTHTRSYATTDATTLPTKPHREQQPYPISSYQRQERLAATAQRRTTQKESKRLAPSTLKMPYSSSSP